MTVDRPRGDDCHDPAEQRASRPAPRLLRGLALVAFGLLLSVVIGEILLRVVQPIPADQLLPLSYKQERLQRLATGDTFVRFDRELGWVTMPDTTRIDTRITYRNNRAGLRASREYNAEVPPSTTRLAAFGESFTYCQEVDFANCWTDQLERLLAGSEVLNYGVPGYGPDQALLRYGREGQAYHPCAVLIGFMDENVNRAVTRFYPFYQPDTGLVAGKPRFLIQDGQLALLANSVTDARQLADPRWVEATLGPDDRWFYPHLFTPMPLDALKLFQVGRSALYRYDRQDASIQRMLTSYRLHDEALQVSELILARFASDVYAAGATPVVVLFSPASEIDAALHGRPLAHLPLAEWLGARGIPFVDLSAPLVDEARAGGLDAVVAFHYQPRGNAVVARSLASRLPELIAPTCGSRSP